MWLAGVSSLAAAEKRAGKELWEWWLDALSFRSDSAGRLHIRQMLKHPSMQEGVVPPLPGSNWLHGPNCPSSLVECVF